MWTKTIAALAGLMLSLGALGPDPAAAQVGWERTYTLTFNECTPASRRALEAETTRFPGYRDHRPITCAGTHCEISYVSTIAPKDLLNNLYRMLEVTGHRARIGVAGNGYSVTCQEGRRVHPLAESAPRMEVFETRCGKLINAYGDVLFDFDRAYIRSDAVPTLLAVADLIRQDRPYAVEVIGHTDAKGRRGYNQRLSVRRARAVARYLSNAPGLAHTRFVVTGKGETEPRAPNTYPDGADNPRGRQLNRRVEIFLKSRACF